jgi:flagellar biosynthetic protein FlhB
MCLGVLTSVLQVGIFINWENAGFKWQRLDPKNWAKRVFGVELPVNLAKAIFKGLGVVVVAALGVLDLPERLWRLAGLPAAAVAVEIQEVAEAVTYRVAAALVVLALLDVLWTRYRHEEKLMMTRQEVKDEMKDAEGNPHVKQAMKRRMNEVGSQGLREAVGQATVVTTNPTHYAVALRYWRGKDATPVVVAKGADYKAQRIKDLAREQGVPVMEDKPLARALYSLVSEGQAIPVDLYKSVARLLAVVYRRRGYVSRGQSA